jgi:PPK2 family polyphosphate:nucleotide phosphotransferase
MGFKQRYFVEPDAKLKLSRFDPADTGKYKDNDGAAAETKGHIARLHKLQYKLSAENQRSMLVVLQGLDAAGKDGTIRHVISGINPQGVMVADFKEPTPIELAHDFLWRVHPHEPAKGQITIFNRSHYEDVLVVRVHKLVPKSVWSKRYARIRQFEELMGESGVKVVKFFLHISPEEQLRRFGDRLNDPDRNWKISESDYTERELWEEYTEAFQDALRLTSTKEAPWFIVPSDRKWFRDLVIAKILADTLDDMNIKIPAPTVDLDAIRRKYHAAAKEQRKDDRKDLVPGEMKAAEAGAER